MEKWLKEVELDGKYVKLIPMKSDHADQLLAAASEGRLWDLWFTSVPSAATMEEYMSFANAETNADRSLAFVVIDKTTNSPIGATRYCNADSNHRRLEIGYTWYSKSYQKTAVNTECKYLLLTYAFEKLNCRRVEFRTHFHNTASRKAIERIGARQEAVLRNHMVDRGGTNRDTVIFSIVDHEWSMVKQSLEHKMTRS